MKVNWLAFFILAVALFNERINGLENIQIEKEKEDKINEESNEKQQKKFLLPTEDNPRGNNIPKLTGGSQSGLKFLQNNKKPNKNEDHAIKNTGETNDKIHRSFEKNNDGVENQQQVNDKQLLSLIKALDVLIKPAEIETSTTKTKLDESEKSLSEHENQHYNLYKFNNNKNSARAVHDSTKSANFDDRNNSEIDRRSLPVKRKLKHWDNIVDKDKKVKQITDGSEQKLKNVNKEVDYGSLLDELTNVLRKFEQLKKSNLYDKGINESDNLQSARNDDADVLKARAFETSITKINQTNKSELSNKQNFKIMDGLGQKENIDELKKDKNEADKLSNISQNDKNLKESEKRDLFIDKLKKFNETESQQNNENPKEKWNPNLYTNHVQKRAHEERNKQIESLQDNEKTKKNEKNGIFGSQTPKLVHEIQVTKTTSTQDKEKNDKNGIPGSQETKLVHERRITQTGYQPNYENRIVNGNHEVYVRQQPKYIDTIQIKPAKLSNYYQEDKANEDHKVFGSKISNNNQVRTKENQIENEYETGNENQTDGLFRKRKPTRKPKDENEILRNILISSVANSLGNIANLLSLKNEADIVTRSFPETKNQHNRENLTKTKIHKPSNIRSTEKFDNSPKRTVTTENEINTKEIEEFLKSLDAPETNSELPDRGKQEKLEINKLSRSMNEQLEDFNYESDAGDREPVDESKKLLNEHKGMFSARNVHQNHKINTLENPKRIEDADTERLIERARLNMMKNVLRIAGPKQCRRIRNLRNVSYPDEESLSESFGYYDTEKRLFEKHERETYICIDPPKYPNYFFKLQTVTKVRNEDNDEEVIKATQRKFYDFNGKEFDWEPNESN